LELSTNSLIERVDRLVEGTEPLLSTSSTSVAIRELVARNDSLEKAVRAVARGVQKLAAPSDR
jgi:hypothetical protein